MEMFFVYLNIEIRLRYEFNSHAKEFGVHSNAHTHTAHIIWLSLSARLLMFYTLLISQSVGLARAFIHCVVFVFRCFPLLPLLFLRYQALLVFVAAICLFCICVIHSVYVFNFIWPIVILIPYFRLQCCSSVITVDWDWIFSESHRKRVPCSITFVKTPEAISINAKKIVREYSENRIHRLSRRFVVDDYCDFLYSNT